MQSTVEHVNQTAPPNAAPTTFVTKRTKKNGSTRCAHCLMANKRPDQIRNLVQFATTASKDELSTRLVDCWSSKQCSVTEAQLLLALGASPEQLYEDNFGQRTLEKRLEEGSVCLRCVDKYREFLALALQIHDAQFMNIGTSCTNSTNSAESGGQDSGIGSSWTHHGSGEKQPAPGPKIESAQQCLLCLSLDGGGIRGLVSVVCLLFASRRCFSGDEGALLRMVDWFIGCSTGSMLSLALAKGYSLRDCFFLYWGMKDEIFLDKSNTMKRLFGDVMDRQTANVCEVLARVFTDDDTFDRCPKRLTVPTLNVATSPAKLHTFRNYPISGSHCDQHTTFRDAARASSAAPTYFHPHILGEGAKYVDGSLVANCPLNLLFRELDKCTQSGDSVILNCVISVGTGEPSERVREYDHSGRGLSSRSKHLREVTALLMEQAVGYEQSACAFAEDRCRAQGIPFYRLNPAGVDCRIDQVKDARLADLIWLTLKYLLDSTNLVDKSQFQRPHK